MFDPGSVEPKTFTKEPPVKVLVLIDGHWWPGKLDRWVQEHDGWYGRVNVDRTGMTNWYPAIALRKAES